MRHSARGLSNAARALMAATLASLLLAGCASKEPGRYYSPKDGFSVKFPPAWEVKEGFNGSSVSAFCQYDPQSGKSVGTVTIFVKELAHEVSAGDYERLHAAPNSPAIKKFAFTEKGDVVVDRKKGVWHVYEVQTENLSLRSIQYMMPVGKKLYAITGSSDPKTFEAFRPVVESVVGTFRFQ